MKPKLVLLMLFLFSVSLLLVAGCTTAPKAKELLTCDLADYTPKPPPPVRTTAELAKFSIDLELSREKLMAARDDCNDKLVKLQKDK